MLYPPTPERIRELVSRANQELIWASKAGNDVPRIAINIREVKIILKKLILPRPAGVIDNEYAVQFVNGSSPTPAVRLHQDIYDSWSIRPTGEVEPEEIVTFKRWAESARLNDTVFGDERLIGVRAMILAVPDGGKLQVNPNGTETWLAEYQRINTNNPS